ncbi:MAG TPA: WS/DGAT domain-containing protein, partial [Pseudomonadales bacterium]|nr:WS/DGAT domain-containing protein [Pseudomonadales bacterium]
VGLLTPGVGLFHLVMSYCGTVTISILGDRESMPDPNFYRECLEKSMIDLKTAALKKGKLIKHKPKAEVTAVRKPKEASTQTATS